jgi:hypothetical protein
MERKCDPNTNYFIQEDVNLDPVQVAGYCEIFKWNSWIHTTRGTEEQRPACQQDSIVCSSMLTSRAICRSVLGTAMNQGASGWALIALARILFQYK